MALIIAILFAALAAAPASAWQLGRATFYGTDAWSIHTGSCGYGQLAEDVGTGWDVAALTDAVSDYKGSCGKCKEVKCKPIGFKDGYGAWLDRSSVCYDPSASVVVMITDTCPCQYPGNYASNKRWCCGDMYHLDVSHWAFEKLADTKWGVIATEWRDVDCGYRPAKQARRPWGGKTSMPDWYKPRPGWNRWMDKRIAFVGDKSNNSGRKMLGA
ncbi:MAG: RlpA-like double-psi beta-barrel-protein domain-containing protein-containing protein [Monoraphidium minutum]|nr:MAG: RlpA-like double-psi beta-barrel-protein domain-containing protein-containing protein [Monoraphidium minutum]